MGSRKANHAGSGFSFALPHRGWWERRESYTPSANESLNGIGELLSSWAHSAAAFPPPTSTGQARGDRVLPDLLSIRRELRNTYLTLQLLWEEVSHRACQAADLPLNPVRRALPALRPDAYTLVSVLNIQPGAENPFPAVLNLTYQL